MKGGINLQIVGRDSLVIYFISNIVVVARGTQFEYKYSIYLDLIELMMSFPTGNPANMLMVKEAITCS